MMSLVKKVACLFIAFVGLASFTMSDSSQKERILATLVVDVLNNAHYQPIALDDNFSVKVYTLFLKRLDVNKRFFTADDTVQFYKYRNDIDEEVKNGTNDFFETTSTLFMKRLSVVKEYYTEILGKPFDFTVKETLETEPSKISYAKDLDELKDYWRKSLKYQVLTRLSTSLDIQETATLKNDTSVKIKTFAALEEEARKQTLKSQDDWFRRIEKLSREDRFSLYLNTISNVYCPHSEYFPPRDKENFDIAMSGKLEGIGATLQEKDGYIKVASIVPGSPSYLQGQLKVNDLILKVAQGTTEPVDIVDMRLDDAVRLIRGKKGTEVRLTVKKVDGSIVIIPIIRDVVIIDETYAKSAVINEKNNSPKIGYLYLPKFYADMNDNEGRFCGEDVLKEIEKLKKEKIQGLVLDLRDNGGGSLQEAVKIAGFFIKSGPIVQVKARLGNPQILSDTDPHIQYDGPLVVLVNALSASASEIVAAALQDYKRAVIIGSKSTFGKGTVQRFFDLDDLTNFTTKSYKPLGSLKVTIQKFYRINGGSTQLKGVVPNIELPDQYKYMKVGEQEEDYFMPWSQINPVKFEPWTKTVAISKLNKESEARTAHEEFFTEMNEYANFLKKQDDESLVSLNLDEYRKAEKTRAVENKKLEKARNLENNLDIIADSDDQRSFATDTAKKVRFDNRSKELKKDLYLEESYRVITDMIKH
jgi:carboxyl-terminal processing protease